MVVHMSAVRRRKELTHGFRVCSSRQSGTNGEYLSQRAQKPQNGHLHCIDELVLVRVDVDVGLDDGHRLPSHLHQLLLPP